MPRRCRACCWLGPWLVFFALDAAADTATLSASQDATLYETATPTADAGNGAGNYTFTGVTKDGLARRALFRFDIAADIPAGATVDSVQLQMNVSKVPSPLNPADVRLHRVSASWDEGASDASGEEGQGQSPPALDDATWRHRSYNDEFWDTPGGDYTPGASATQTLGGLGIYTWGNTAMAGRAGRKFRLDPHRRRNGRQEREEIRQPRIFQWGSARTGGPVHAGRTGGILL